MAAPERTVPVCLECGMVGPPPDQTCVAAPGSPRDHFVGTGHGCWNCGRLKVACERRPCQAMRGDPGG